PISGPLEEMVRAGRIAAQCVLVGEQRPFISAIVALDPEELVLWAKANGLGTMTLAEAAINPAVIAEIQSYVDTANLTVSKAESIRKFVVLEDEFTEASGHLTNSLKLKRQSVLDQFEDRIEAFYRK